MKNRTFNKVFMAFSAGTETPEAVEIKKYIGVAPITIVAVNPTKAELEKIYGRTLDKDVEYTSTTEIDGKTVETARIDFIIKTVKDKCPYDITSKLTYFLTNAYRYNKDKSKVQVIDKYGRTAWVPVEQAKNHEIPVYANGPANIDKDYRPCYIGEKELTEAMIQYLGVPNVMKYVNNTWVMTDRPQDSEARLDKISNYFKGDFKELVNLINLQPNNKVKVMFTIRTTDDGTQFQSVYNGMLLYANTKNYDKLKKEVEERKTAGALSTTEFEFCDIKEYVVKPTEFNNTEEDDDMPFDTENIWK